MLPDASGNCSSTRESGGAGGSGAGAGAGADELNEYVCSHSICRPHCSYLIRVLLTTTDVMNRQKRFGRMRLEVREP